MFGYVTANFGELTQQQKQRYGSIYCGICRRIREQASQTARLGLSYDMAFLAMLLMSLYEPEESSGEGTCLAHPFQKKTWVDGELIRYAADMNTALAYYKAVDDVKDDGSISGKLMARALRPCLEPIASRYPRQTAAIRDGLKRLSLLEQEGCTDPDAPAGIFGELLGELLVYREDLWAPTLRRMGSGLGRFIYLADAMVDYQRDSKKGRYNPLLARGLGRQEEQWQEYLVLAMSRCCDAYERLPLVQDKDILDNILYSGVWTYKRKKRGDKT